MPLFIASLADSCNLWFRQCQVNSWVRRACKLKISRKISHRSYNLIICCPNIRQELWINAVLPSAAETIKSLKQPFLQQECASSLLIYDQLCNCTQHCYAILYQRKCHLPLAHQSSWVICVSFVVVFCYIISCLKNTISINVFCLGINWLFHVCF